MLNKMKIKDGFTFRNAQVNDIEDMIDIIGNYYEDLGVDCTATNKYREPWIWMSDSSLSFKVLLNDVKIICGFFIARHIDKNTHLHSLFVRKEYRNIGLGKILIAGHWENAMKVNPGIETLTLHVYKKNTSVINLYSEYGYKKIVQNPLLAQQSNGFGR